VGVGRKKKTFKIQSSEQRHIWTKTRGRLGASCVDLSTVSGSRSSQCKGPDQGWFPAVCGNRPGNVLPPLSPVMGAGFVSYGC
jgi:hypothetical protein